MTTDSRPDDGPDPTYCTHTDYRDGPTIDDLPATGADATGPAAEVWSALHDVEDPEMPVSIVDLGLIYGVTVEDGHATVSMTLTYTGCPAREILTDEVEAAARTPDPIDDATVELVWNPPWNVELVTEAGKEDLREWGVSI